MGLKGQSEKMDEYEINTQIQVDKLCRGGQMRVIKILHNYITTILINLSFDLLYLNNQIINIYFRHLRRGPIFVVSTQIQTQNGFASDL